MGRSPEEETDVNFSRFVASVKDESGTLLLPVFTVNLVQYPVVIEANGDTRDLISSDLLESGFELVTSTLREEAISSAREAMPHPGKCWINLSPETVEVVVRIGQENTSLAIAPIGVSDPIDMTFRRGASNGCVLLVSAGGFEYDDNWEITNFAEAVTHGSVVAGKIPIHKVF